MAGIHTHTHVHTKERMMVGDRLKVRVFSRFSGRSEFKTVTRQPERMWGRDTF